MKNGGAVNSSFSSPRSLFIPITTILMRAALPLIIWQVSKQNRPIFKCNLPIFTYKLPDQKSVGSASLPSTPMQERNKLR